MVQIEKEKGIEGSKEYLDRFLKEHGDDITIDNLLENIHRLY